jgi:hypothetical protein
MKKLDLALAIIRMSPSYNNGLISYEIFDDRIEVWNNLMKDTFRETDLIAALNAFPTLTTCLFWDESEKTLKLRII